MKKTRLLAMTLVVAIMMMGAGYAYWSQDLTINNTVDTGILAVSFQEPANVDGEDLYQPNADMTPNGEVATITFTDVYPGAENELYFDLKNDGTLKAFVDDFTIVNDEIFFPGGGVQNTITEVILVDDLCIDGVEVGTDGQTLAQALAALNVDNGVPVEYNDRTQISMVLTFDPNATEAEMPENDSLTFDIEAGVYQFNEVRQ